MNPSNCMRLISKTRPPMTSRNTTRHSRRSGRPCQVCPFLRYPDYYSLHQPVEHPRIAARITEGEAKRNKRDNLEFLLEKKIHSVRYPMQELELNYPTTKGKVYSEEEDRYLLCRLFHYGMQTDDVYERLKKDITEFPVFRFDWFFKSRSPQELQRRCNTLLGMIEKEAETRQQEEMKAVKSSSAKTKVGGYCFPVYDRMTNLPFRSVLLMRCKRQRSLDLQRPHRGQRGRARRGKLST